MSNTFKKELKVSGADCGQESEKKAAQATPHIGIAIGGGVDVTVEAGQYIVLVRSDPRDIPGSSR